MSSNVFSGLEGLITPDQLQQRRSATLDKAIAQSANQLKGTQFAARTAGLGIGNALANRFGNKSADEQAQGVQDAVTQAQADAADMTFTGDAADVDQRIAVVQGTIRNLLEQGNTQAAQQLTRNLVQLREQRTERRKSILEIEGAELSNEEKGLNIDLNKLKVAATQDEGGFSDQLSRLQSRREQLDPLNPKDAKQIDEINRRLEGIIEGKQTVTNVDKKQVRDDFEALGEASDQLERMEGILGSFNPQFQTLAGKVEGFALTAGDILGLDLDDGNKALLSDFTNQRARVAENFNMILKSRSGSAVTSPEAARAMQEVVNSKDGPIVFQTKAVRALDALAADVEKAKRIALADSEGASNAEKIAARTFDKSAFIEQRQAERAQAAASEPEAEKRAALLEKIRNRNRG